MFLNNRRTFLKGTVFTTTTFFFSSTPLFASTPLLDTIDLAQKDLYGDSSEAPVFEDINARAYMSIILTHSRIDEDTKKFIRNGAIWLDEEADTLYKKPYISLNYDERQKTLKSASEYKWGDSWIYEMLTYLYEASLGDTIYGINKNGGGWKWLNHETGTPRPKEPLL